ncbi:MAG: 50S ribosomal protein L4 [bacterium]|nr:50S ribosomal protein L4 [bacterium]
MATTVKIESLPELLIEQPNPLHIQESYLRQVANGTPFTASKKNKARVNGSTAKIYRQKGTGRARQGERTNVHMRGGGLAFPPLPRLQTKRMNKHTRRSALRSAVLHHILAGSAWRIDGGDFIAFEKTKQVATVLEGVGARTMALVIPVGSQVQRNCRNIGWVRVLSPHTLNVRDLVDCQCVVFASDALDQYRQLLELQNNPVEEEEVEIEFVPSARQVGKAKAKAKAEAAGVAPKTPNVRKTSAQRTAARKVVTDNKAADSGVNRSSGPKATAAKAAATKRSAKDAATAAARAPEADKGSAPTDNAGEVA